MPSRPVALSLSLSLSFVSAHRPPTQESVDSKFSGEWRAGISRERDLIREAISLPRIDEWLFVGFRSVENWYVYMCSGYTYIGNKK